MGRRRQGKARFPPDMRRRPSSSLRPSLPLPLPSSAFPPACRPIRQHATGRAGLYRTLMVEAKKMRLDEFRDMAREPVNAAPKVGVSARRQGGRTGQGVCEAWQQAHVEG